MDIINDVIAEEFPQLILDWYPKAFWETFPQEILEACPEGLLWSEIFRFNFKQKLNNEFFSKDGKKFISDSPFETFEKIIIGLEFQSVKIDFEREAIFNMYQAGLHKEHKKRVLTVVFSMVNDKHELIKHKVGLSDEFTILIISLKALNQKQTLNNSLYKISNNISFSDKEKALFLASPLMDRKNILGAINEISGSFYKISNLTVNEEKEMESIILLYLGRWCPKELNDDEGDNVVVLTPEAKRLKERWMKEIKEEVQEETEGKMVQKLLEDGFMVDDVLKYTSLKRSQVIALSNAIVLK